MYTQIMYTCIHTLSYTYIEYTYTTYAHMHIILTIHIFRVFLFILINHPKSLALFFLNRSTHFVTKAILNHNTDSKCYIKRMGSCSTCSIHDCLFSPCEYLLLALGMDTHALTHSLTHSPTHLLTHPFTHLFTHPLTHQHTCMHQHTYVHAYAHTYACRYTHTHTYTYIKIVAINNPVTDSCACMHHQI